MTYQNIRQNPEVCAFLAKGDAKQLKKIEDEYAKAKRKEEIARKRALGEDVTLTWREQIEEFFAWFDTE